MNSVFFYAFAVVTLTGALATISLRNPVHCALGLLTALLGVAGLFLEQGAEFLFAAQLVVYAGGVVLLFLFAIMLVNLDRARVDRRFAPGWTVGLAASGLIGVELVLLWRAAQFGPAQGPLARDNPLAFADTLLNEYLLPFEIVSVLLLAALVGAVVVAQQKTA